MDPAPDPPPDPLLDLVLERVVEVPRTALWRGWTEPELLMRWFTPAPWQTIDCEIDLRPGGIFRTVMRSPEGHAIPGVGCYLEVEEPARLSWTNALGPGFRPLALAGEDEFPFTATVTFSPAAHGTRFRAVAIHRDEAGCRQHAAMGFHEGWGKALDQLVALIRGH